MSAQLLSMSLANGSLRPAELNGLKVEGVTEDGAPTDASANALEFVLRTIRHLSQENLEEV